MKHNLQQYIAHPVGVTFCDELCEILDFVLRK